MPLQVHLKEELPWCSATIKESRSSRSMLRILELGLNSSSSLKFSKFSSLLIQAPKFSTKMARLLAWDYALVNKFLVSLEEAFLSTPHSRMDHLSTLTFLWSNLRYYPNSKVEERDLSNKLTVRLINNVR
jgi:hypothetical protein